MTTDPVPEEQPRPRSVMRPLAFGLGLVTIAHPFGGAGLITLFPGWGILGLGRTLRSRLLRRVVVVALMWSGSMALSAEVHGNKLVTQLAMYGVVTLLTVSGLWWFHHSVGLRRETVVLMGALGWLVLDYTHGRAVGFSGNAWKYAIGPPIAISVLALAWRLKTPRLVTAGLLGGLAAISLIHDSRFPAGLSVVVAVAVLVHKRRVVTKGSIVRQLVVFVAGVILVFYAYPPLASHGYFGHRAQQQETTIRSEGINFLFDNRPEMAQSAWLAAHHPLLGIGPGSSISSEESARSIQFLIGLGLPMDINRERYLHGDSEDGQVGLGYAAHSSAIDSVTHGGLLAAPFWLLYLFLLLRMVLARGREDVHAVPTVLWLGLLGIWDVLFSPLVGTQWIELGLAIFLAASSPSARPQTADAEPTAQTDTQGETGHEDELVPADAASWATSRRPYDPPEDDVRPSPRP